MAYPNIILVKAWILLILSTLVHGQTFPDWPLTNTWPNLSSGCLAALNTTVECSPILPASAENNVPRLNAQNLTSLCTSTCLSSLNSAQTVIKAACTAPNDVLPLDFGTYPATFLIDLFKYTYNLNCRRDATTNEYCDVLFVQWLNQPLGQLTAAQNCSDCMLGTSQLQLNSPFGYSPDFASSFSSLTSSCSKTGYGFTQPPPYVPATTSGTASTTSSAVPTPTDVLGAGCVRIYTVQSGDTCNSVAAAQNVSSYAVHGSSGFRDCSNLPTGAKVCLLGQCRNYQVQEGDTCDSIIAAAGITVSASMFVAWNPNINPLCTNLASLTGNYICLSRPDGLLTPNITLPSAGGLATASVWPSVVPTTEAQLPRAPGTLTGCTQYTNYRETGEMDSFYQPQVPGYTSASNLCSYVASSYGVTVANLMTWNPSLNTTGTNSMNCTLAAGYSYCVQNGNTTIPFPSTKACITANSTLIPQGTTFSCNCYTVISGYDVGTMDCEILQEDFKITLADLQSWNPWLAGSLTACTNALFSGLVGGAKRQICVGTGAGSTGSSSLSTTTTSSSSSSALTSTTSTTSTTRTSTSTTSSANTPVTSTPGSVCIAGTDTGNTNQAGLCSFSCHYGYCPPGPCVCTAYGTQVPPPPTTGVAGYKLAWEDDSYIGLCSFVYNHGYYPTGACTTNPDGSPQV